MKTLSLLHARVSSAVVAIQQYTLSQHYLPRPPHSFSKQSLVRISTRVLLLITSRTVWLQAVAVHPAVLRGVPASSLVVFYWLQAV